MSLYRVAWLFTAWTILVVGGLVSALPLLREWLGAFGLAVAMAIGLAHGLVALYGFACRDCGLSPFLSGKGLLTGYAPWPRKTCGHCGRDHSQAA